MIEASEFVEILKKKDFRFFTGVPCSFFQAAINRVIDDKDLRYVIAPNEGSALGLAAGACLGGNKAAVMIQNSGLGNLINPLTSLNMIYGLPALLFISGRAYGVPDEPQHEIIGKTMGAMLDALGVQRADMPAEPASFEKALEEASERMQKQKTPFAFLVKKGSISEYSSQSSGAGPYPLKRIEAIRLITEALGGDEYVVATTGKPSRELFSVCDRDRNFYMQGSMGHAAAVGLGVALNRPDKKVVILDGDGALLMHMGILSTIGHYAPPNLHHVVLDNESYETTGDQDTTSAGTDFAQIARSCGYRVAAQAVSEKELKEELGRLLREKGPNFLRVKINRLPTENVARISSRYTSVEIAANFKKALIHG